MCYMLRGKLQICPNRIGELMFSKHVPSAPHSPNWIEIPRKSQISGWLNTLLNANVIRKIDTIPTKSSASSLTSSAASKWKVSSTVQRTAWLSSARWRLGVYWRPACRWAQTDLLGTSHKLIKAKVKIIKNKSLAYVWPYLTKLAML